MKTDLIAYFRDSNYPTDMITFEIWKRAQEDHDYQITIEEYNPNSLTGILIRIYDILMKVLFLLFSSNLTNQTGISIGRRIIILKTDIFKEDSAKGRSHRMYNISKHIALMNYIYFNKNSFQDKKKINKIRTTFLVSMLLLLKHYLFMFFGPIPIVLNLYKANIRFIEDRAVYYFSTVLKLSSYTSELIMEDFYRYIKDGMSKERASAFVTSEEIVKKKCNMIIMSQQSMEDILNPLTEYSLMRLSSVVLGFIVIPVVGKFFSDVLIKTTIETIRLNKKPINDLAMIYIQTEIERMKNEK